MKMPRAVRLVWKSVTLVYRRNLNLEAKLKRI